MGPYPGLLMDFDVSSSNQMRTRTKPPLLRFFMCSPFRDQYKKRLKIREIVWYIYIVYIYTFSPVNLLKYYSKRVYQRYKYHHATRALSPLSPIQRRTTQKNVLCNYSSSLVFIFCFLPEVIFRSRVIGVCPVTTDCFVAMG